MYRFGSTAQGTATGTSDADIAVLSRARLDPVQSVRGARQKSLDHSRGSCRDAPERLDCYSVRTELDRTGSPPLDIPSEPVAVCQISCALRATRTAMQSDATEYRVRAWASPHSCQSAEWRRQVKVAWHTPGWPAIRGVAWRASPGTFCVTAPGFLLALRGRSKVDTGIVVAGEPIRTAVRDRVVCRDVVPLPIPEGDMVRALATIDTRMLLTCRARSGRGAHPRSPYPPRLAELTRRLLDALYTSVSPVCPETTAFDRRCGHVS